jgi:outer membrane autotransporter protein
MAGVDADSFNTTEDLNALANLIDVADDATANVTGNVHVDEGLLNGAIDMTVDYENVDGDELLNGVIKDVRQGTSTTVEATSGVAANAAVAWREEDATFSQRLGELRSSKEGQGVWARFVQGEFERGNNFETEYNMFQIGYDKAKGDWHYGLAVNHTEGDTTYAAGSGELSNTSLSAYGTWLGERGHYKDIVAKVGSISSDYSINAAGQLTKGEYDTYGTSLSAEYGMKNDMGKGWFVTPLAKMTYMHIGGDSYTTNNGINVKHDAIDSLVARLGVELGKELGNKGAVYVKASALHDFCGDADTTLRLGSNSALLTDEIGGTWYEVGFGFNYKMSDATNLYADVIKTYGDEIRTPWQWNAGVRYSF